MVAGSFAYLAKNVEEMYATGEAGYPAERVLLTSGVLEAALSTSSTGRFMVPPTLWWPVNPLTPSFNCVMRCVL